MPLRTVDVPQADTLPLVVKLLATIWPTGKESKETIASELGIDPRQVDYYMHAARILGFVEGTQRNTKFTQAGKALMSATQLSERNSLLREAALETPIIGELLRRRRPEEISARFLESYLRRHTSLTGSTIPRRARTLLSWIHTVEGFDPLDTKSAAIKVADSSEAQFSAYRSREEGETHRGIKNSIAANPEKYLGERLILIQVEYPFPTNDRADVLFVTDSGQYVVVEVEVDVGPHDIPGLLQAVKYKHMLAVIFGLQANDVRSLLVARSIAPEMKERASDFSIDCIEVGDLS